MKAIKAIKLLVNLQNTLLWIERPVIIMVKRYLISQTYFGNEKPCCYFGTGAYVLPYPMPVYVKENFCYKTRKQAEKQAEKCNMWYKHTYFQVIEILV